jgi:acetamidase/formamidase
VIHELPLERRTLHGHFSCELPPVLEAAPGDSVRFRALNAGWRWAPDREFIEHRDPALDEGHALIGPSAVTGARAGAVLSVRIDEVHPRDWGVTFGDGEMFTWSLDVDAGIARDDQGAAVGLDPFLGVIGMPPPERRVHPTGPPRRFGGNIDCKLLGVGTTLFLPIPVDGALLSVGDGHAAQGDGEVSGTAIECPLERAQVTLGLVEDLELSWPVARTSSSWVSFGFDEDLEAATGHAVETMLDLMERELAVRRPHALALASVAVDLRVTQVVNGVKGVHAVLRDEAIRFGDNRA